VSSQLPSVVLFALFHGQGDGSFQETHIRLGVITSIVTKESVQIQIRVRIQRRLVKEAHLVQTFWGVRRRQPESKDRMETVPYNTFSLNCGHYLKLNVFDIKSRGFDAAKRGCHNLLLWTFFFCVIQSLELLVDVLGLLFGVNIQT
jgi:hypothetical protein